MSFTFADGGELDLLYNPSNLNLFNSTVSYIYGNYAAELRCPGPDWYEFGEFCYKPSADKKTWRDARETCRSLGADLVSIRSMTEQSWLESYLYTGKYLKKQEVEWNKSQRMGRRCKATLKMTSRWLP